MALFFSLLCLFEVFVLYSIEKSDDYRITPMICLGFPYSLVMILVSFVDIVASNKYDKMGFEVPLLSFILIFIFGVVGHFVLGLQKRRRGFYFTGYSRVLPDRKYNHHQFIILGGYLFLFLIAILMVRLKDLNSIKAFSSSGIIAHLINVECALLILNFSFDVDSMASGWLKLFALIWVLFLAVASSKYMALFFAVALLLVFVSRNSNAVSLFRIVLLLGAVAVVFFFTYIMRAVISNSAIDISFILRHFFYYLTGSFYAFSNVINGIASPTAGVGYGIIISPIINVINLLRGAPFVSSISGFTEINILNGYSQTNVYTYFGSLLLECGFFGVVICTICLSCFAYLLYSSLLYERSDTVLSAFSYLCATLVFGFFNCFYGTSNIWEIFILFLVLDFIDRFSLLNNYEDYVIQCSLRKT